MESLEQHEITDHDSMLVTSDGLAQEKALFFDDLGSVYPPPKDDQDSKALFHSDPLSSIQAAFPVYGHLEIFHTLLILIAYSPVCRLT